MPRFLQYLVDYIGILTPMIFAAAVGVSADHARPISDIIANDIRAPKGLALIPTVLIIGVGFAAILAYVLGRIRLQVLASSASR